MLLAVSWHALFLLTMLVVFAIGYGCLVVAYRRGEAQAHREGQTLTGVLMQANNALFQPGTQNSPGVVLASFDAQHATELETIADRIGKLAQKKTLSRDEQAIVKAAFARIPLPWKRTLLPLKYTDGKEVFLVSLCIERKLLPKQFLLSRTVKLKAMPGPSGRVYLASSSLKKKRSAPNSAT